VLKFNPYRMEWILRVWPELSGVPVDSVFGDMSSAVSAYNAVACVSGFFVAEPGRVLCD